MVLTILQILSALLLNFYYSDMCKFSSGCGSSDSINCKNCGQALCKQCKRSLKTGNPVPSGNAANCPDCRKNYKWSHPIIVEDFAFNSSYSLFWSYAWKKWSIIIHPWSRSEGLRTFSKCTSHCCCRSPGGARWCACRALGWILSDTLPLPLPPKKCRAPDCHFSLGCSPEWP